MVQATTFVLGGWPRWLMMPATFIRPIIFVARSCSLGVGRVGLKQTAFEGESVARSVVQLLERKLVPAASVGGSRVGRPRFERRGPASSLVMGLLSGATRVSGEKAW